MENSKIQIDSSKIRAVFFDLDGVIINSAPDIAWSLNKMLVHYGYKEVPEDIITKFVGKGAKLLLKRTLAFAKGMDFQCALKDDYESPVPEAEFSQMLDWYLNCYKENPVKNTVLYPGVKEMLEFFYKRGMKMAAVSNKPSFISQKILKVLQIDKYFDVLIGPEESGKTKPAPDGLILALKLINDKSKSDKSERKPSINPKQVIMTGDSSFDVLAGKAFGSFTCAVLNGYGNRTELLQAGPDYQVPYAGDLISLFN